MIISTGIDAKYKETVRKLIFKEMENMKNGVIDEVELETAIKSITAGLDSLNDSQEGIVDVNLSNVLFDLDLSIKDFKELISKVRIEDVVNISKNIVLDTEYILTSNAKQKGGDRI